MSVLVTKKRAYIPLSAILGPDYKRKMLFFPMDFRKLTIEELLDTGVLTSATPETLFRKFRLLTPQSIIKEGPPPNF